MVLTGHIGNCSFRPNFTAIVRCPWHDGTLTTHGTYRAHHAVLGFAPSAKGQQLSAFQCRPSVQRHAELIALLDGIIHHSHDHVILMDAGLADQIAPRVVSLGNPYLPVECGPVIV